MHMAVTYCLFRVSKLLYDGKFATGSFDEVFQSLTYYILLLALIQCMHQLCCGAHSLGITTVMSLNTGAPPVAACRYKLLYGHHYS